MRTIVAALLVLVLTAGATTAAQRTIRIEAAGFDPPVVVVPPGTEVVWKNVDSRVHGIAGSFATSPRIRPGGEFKHVFRELGEYPYRETGSDSMRGTVIVALGGGGGGGGGGSPGPPPPGRVVHPYDAVLTVEMRESSRYRDGHWASLDGPCNGQVGRTSRTVRYSVRLRNAKYDRLPPFELFTTDATPVRMGLFREVVDSKASDLQKGPMVPCPDGETTDAAPVHDVDCERRLDGKPLKIKLSWSRAVARGAFQFGNDGPPPGGRDQCGLSYLNTLVLSTAANARLPVSFGGAHMLFDAGATSPLTAAEVRALRAGRAVTITRDLHLRYTTDCCAGWNDGQVNGVLARIGEVREAFAKVTIRLTPR